MAMSFLQSIGCTKKSRDMISGLCFQLWRRGWDSNPRCCEASPVFKTGSLNHSDTSPQCYYYSRNPIPVSNLLLFAANEPVIMISTNRGKEVNAAQSAFL